MRLSDIFLSAELVCPERSFIKSVRTKNQVTGWNTLDDVGMTTIEIMCDDKEETERIHDMSDEAVKPGKFAPNFLKFIDLIFKLISKISYT